MDNDTNNMTSASPPVPSYALEYDSFVVSYNAAFYTCLTLGILTLLLCLCAIRRRYKRCHNTSTTITTRASCCAHVLSWLCTLSFFPMLATGLFLIAASAQQYRTAVDQQQQQQYGDLNGRGPGLVRIIDTRVVAVGNITNNNNLRNNETIVAKAQARVVFGGDAYCPISDDDDNSNRTNATSNGTIVLCDTYSDILSCSQTAICDSAATTTGNGSQHQPHEPYCSEENETEIQEAMDNATECLSRVTRGIELPIDNVTISNINWTVLPLWNDSTFALIEGFWDCDTCNFVDIQSFERIYNDRTMSNYDNDLKTIGIGLICGATAIFVMWLVVKVTCTIVMRIPKGNGLVVTSSPRNNNNTGDWQHLSSSSPSSAVTDMDLMVVESQQQQKVLPQRQQQQQRRRVKRFSARQWVRSKQWVQGSPIPQAYSPNNVDDDYEDYDDYYYNNNSSRDGLEMVQEEKGGARADKVEQNGPAEGDADEDDDLPDYWRQWNEETSNNAEAV